MMDSDGRSRKLSAATSPAYVDWSFHFPGARQRARVTEDLWTNSQRSTFPFLICQKNSEFFIQKFFACRGIQFAGIIFVRFTEPSFSSPPSISEAFRQTNYRSRLREKIKNSSDDIIRATLSLRNVSGVGGWDTEQFTNVKHSTAWTSMKRRALAQWEDWSCKREHLRVGVHWAFEGVGGWIECLVPSPGKLCD